jgi:copper chaperone CopZ
VTTTRHREALKSYRPGISSDDSSAFCPVPVRRSHVQTDASRTTPASHRTEIGHGGAARWCLDRPRKGDTMAGVGGVLSLSVPGMTCPARVRVVTAQLRDVEGVQNLEADASRERVCVRGTMSAAEVLRVLDASGFPGALDERPTAAGDGASSGA